MLCAVAAAAGLLAGRGREKSRGQAAIGVLGGSAAAYAIDNLSGVAVALAAASALNRAPLPGLRVLFVSAGAEEALQQGIRGFARAHFSRLDPGHTWFLTLDTVGSGNLVMLEGEGTVRMHDYDTPFKDLVAGCARQAGIPLIRGLRSRNSTDGCVPMRYGFPTVTLVSVNDQKLLPNYHQYSDTPENVDYRSVRAAAQLTETVARRLAAGTAFTGRGRGAAS
jgi:Zn-dependent M28 family amino/carboxypeptidase